MKSNDTLILFAMHTIEMLNKECKKYGHPVKFTNLKCYQIYLQDYLQNQKKAVRHIISVVVERGLAN